MRTLAAIIFDFDGVLGDCEHGTLLPGAEAFVRDAAAVVPLGIASGAMSHAIEDILDAHGLAGCFTSIIGVDRAVRSKPAPDPFLEALHRIAASGFVVEPSRTVAIDDSVWGLVAARTARLRCVGVARPGRHHSLAPHAELVVDGLERLTLDTLDTLVRGRDPDPTHAR
jgi:beta-phosphoglucomutase